MKIEHSDNKNPFIFKYILLGFSVACLLFILLVVRHTESWLNMRSTILAMLDTNSIDTAGIYISLAKVFIYLIILLLALFSTYLFNKSYYYRENFTAGVYWRNYMMRLFGITMDILAGFWALTNIVHIISSISFI